MRPTVSVIIPTLREAATIGACLSDLAVQRSDEVIVVDGGSPDQTAGLARRRGATLVESPRGRGVQQNRGAAASTGEVLVFLHADCRLEAGALDTLRRYIARNPRVPGGCFRMCVEAPGLAFRLIDAAAHLRAGACGVPYGDQAIFCQRWAFEAVGGFPEQPLMEDVLMSLRLQRLGRLALLPARVHVSPRRWLRAGLVRQTLRNWSLTVAVASGVPVEVLARFYPIVR